MSIFPGPQPGGGSSGPVAVGDIDATGTPSASTYLRGDGAWASAGGADPVTNTLGSAAQSLSLTGLTGNVHQFRFDGVSNAATNDVFLTVNAGTSQTGHTWQFSYNIGGAMAYTSLADTAVIRNQLAANERFHVSGTASRFYDGTNTYFTLDIFCQTPAGIGVGTIYTSAAGDVALTAINLRSSQATGIKSGAVGSAQKVG